MTRGKKERVGKRGRGEEGKTNMAPGMQPHIGWWTVRKFYRRVQFPDSFFGLGWQQTKKNPNEQTTMPSKQNSNGTMHGLIRCSLVIVVVSKDSSTVRKRWSAREVVSWTADKWQGRVRGKERGVNAAALMQLSTAFFFSYWLYYRYLARWSNAPLKSNSSTPSQLTFISQK